MARSPRRRRRLAAGLVLAVVLVAGGLAAAVASGLLLHDTARPASVEDALRRFRERSHDPGELEGVYLYATRGGESLDALGGAHHRYPPTTSVTAVRVPCGLRLRWEALEGRSMTWTLCTTATGVELRSSEEVHRFFGQTDRTSYACTGSLLLPAHAEAGATRSFRCRSSRGSEAGEARVAGLEDLRVGGGRVSAVRVRTTSSVTGGDRGTETVDWWLDAHTGLPLRILLTSRTSRPMLLGRVHYREDADLRLLSTNPRR